MNKQPGNEFLVKGHDGRCQLYGTLSAYENLSDSVSVVIGDNFDIDDSWWKRTIKQVSPQEGNLPDKVSIKEVTLDLKWFTPETTKRGERSFSLITFEQAKRLVKEIRESLKTS